MGLYGVVSIGLITKGIIYLLDCPCGCFYVGLTRREFSKRIYDHVYTATIGYYKSPIGKHIALAHSYAKVHLTFVPLSHIPPSPRGGDWEKKLLRTEARWIFRLNAPGLNEALSFKPFLK